MHEMDKIKEMICKELEQIARKGEMSAGDLEIVYKLIVAKEKLLRIEEIEQDLGYSQSGGMWSANGSYGRGGRSYATGGDSYADYSIGHYSSKRGYSMSEGKQMIMAEMQDMMNDPSLPPKERQALQVAMDSLKR